MSQSHAVVSTRYTTGTCRGLLMPRASDDGMYNASHDNDPELFFVLIILVRPELPEFVAGFQFDNDMKMKLYYIDDRYYS